MRASWGREFAHYTDHNVLATQRLLEAALAAGRPTVVYASSSSVYGDAPALPLREDGPCRPVSPYGVTKLAAEHLARPLPPQPRPAHGEPALLHRLRPAPAPGHGVPPLPEGGPRRRARSRSTATAGRRATSPTSTTSCAPCARPPLSGRPGSVYNVGGGERVALNEVLRLDRERDRRGPSSIQRQEPQKGDMRDTFADTTAAAARPGLPLDASPSPRASRASGSGSGGCLEAGARRRRGLLAVLPACAEPPARPRGARERLGRDRLGGRARRPSAKKDWESARQYYRRLIDAFPQSEHQPDARIALADSYFEEGGTGNYVLAVSSYREFLTLYPQHPRSDYAQFRAGGVLLQAEEQPGPRPDGDRAGARGVRAAARRLPAVARYVEEARERIHECRQTLARVPLPWSATSTRGRARSWRSAIGRYETIVSDYPDYERLDEVLFRLGQCLVLRRPLRRGPSPPGPPARPSSRRAPRSRGATSSKRPSRLPASRPRPRLAAPRSGSPGHPPADAACPAAAPDA